MNPSHLCAQRTDDVPPAERWLKQMNKVCGHDLPNQLVVLQSLLKLMSMEETERMSEQGQEFVRRLQNASQHASSMVRFLKEMSALGTRAARREPIALAELGRELQGDLQHLYPGRQFSFAWNWHVPAILGDARLFAQAILEMYAGLTHGGAERCSLSASSRDGSGAIELIFRIHEQPSATDPGPGSTPGKPRGLDERLQVILAREWLGLCGAAIENLSTGGAEARFHVIVPGR